MQLINDIEAINAEQQAIVRMRANNDLLLVHYLNQQNNQGIRRGSIPGHVVIVPDWENADHNLFNDYFADNPRFNDSMFRRRFRMSRNLFIRIVDVVKGHDNYFVQRTDGIGRLGLSAFQK